MKPETYLRVLPDGQTNMMVEIAPHQFVNLPAATALGLISRTTAAVLANHQPAKRAAA